MELGKNARVIIESIDSILKQGWPGCYIIHYLNIKIS